MGALAMSMRPLSLSTAADSANCGPRGGDKAWTKKFTCLGVYVFFLGLTLDLFEITHDRAHIS